MTTESEQRRRESIAAAHARNRQEAEANPVHMRRCSKCEEYKHVGLFYLQKTYTKAGEAVYRPMSWCRRCVRRRQNAKRRLQRST